MMNFTNDEMNLMAIYNAGSRAALMDALYAMREYLEADEIELRNMTDGVLEKLDAMTDAEFETLELFPDFDEESILFFTGTIVGFHVRQVSYLFVSNRRNNISPIIGKSL